MYAHADPAQPGQTGGNGAGKCRTPGSTSKNPVLVGELHSRSPSSARPVTEALSATYAAGRMLACAPVTRHRWPGATVTASIEQVEPIVTAAAARLAICKPGVPPQLYCRMLPFREPGGKTASFGAKDKATVE